MGADFFDQLLGDIANKSRWSIVMIAAVHAPRLGIGEIQLLARPRDTHVTEPTFLFESSRFVHRHLVGEQTIFHAGEKDRLKFQPFSAVHGHHLHCVLMLVTLSITRFKCCVRQKGIKNRDLDLAVVFKEDLIIRIKGPRR